jgi:hypothetical protein
MAARASKSGNVDSTELEKIDIMKQMLAELKTANRVSRAAAAAASPPRSASREAGRRRA